MADSSNHDRSRNQGGHSRGRGNGRGGGRGGRGRGSSKGFGSRGGGEKRAGDLGRAEWSRKDVDKRQRNNDEQVSKRQRYEAGDHNAAHPFSKEEIDAEGRKPKRKVAVLIGYAGSGYKGMQINGAEKTIEGDLFKGFIAAGAISKANADDPKKSSLVRCARTDKGVHAAGNVISLKLIVENPDIVKKINENLPEQIRVWGIERTNGSFSCYQTCDSRWYEYLIPTFCFLPPHPQSYLAKKLLESAKKEDVLDSYLAQQEDVATFWKDAEEKYVKPILDELDPALVEEVLRAIHSDEDEVSVSKKQIKKELQAKRKAADDIEPEDGDQKRVKLSIDDTEQQSMELGSKAETTTIAVEELIDESTTEPAAIEDVKPTLGEQPEPPVPESTYVDETVKTESEGPPATEQDLDTKEITARSEEVKQKSIQHEEAPPMIEGGASSEVQPNPVTTNSKSVLTPLEAAIKRVKAAYITAKKAYRISASRKDRVQLALDSYSGTCNFHNYTIQKSFKDPSAKRLIRSFKVGPDPIIINDTEWLSLKVHGQSFMMHQIRKMVAMAAIVVRCGTPTQRIKESYGKENISIPKAPGLGLLLERPVFDSYNEKATREWQKEKIDFNKFEKEMNEFKQREIYDRIFREEEKDHQFHSFFHHIDHYRTDYFLWATATGISAAIQSTAPTRTDDVSDDEQADANGQEG